MSNSYLIDPLGRQIILHERTWFGHILRGHPEMELLRKEVELAVSNPEQIRKSLSDDDCRQYYSSLLDNALRVIVIADIALGLVKTAHLVKKLRGGKLEWSQPIQ